MINKSLGNLPKCPGCGKPAPLAIIKSSDGREWVNCACAPCGYAMDCSDKWVFYVGGVTRNGGSRTKPKRIGREAYEEDLQKTPNYHDGMPRPTWENLRPIARHSWSRPLREDS
jgi:hypothetical protein